MRLELVMCVKSVEDPEGFGFLANKGKIYTKVRHAKCKNGCGLEIIEVEEVKHPHSGDKCGLGPNFLPSENFIPLNYPDLTDLPEYEQTDKPKECELEV